MYVGDSDRPLKPLAEVGYNQKHDSTIAAVTTAQKRHSKQAKSKTQRSNKTATATAPVAAPGQATATAPVAAPGQATATAPPLGENPFLNADGQPITNPDNPTEGDSNPPPPPPPADVQAPSFQPDPRLRTVNEFEPDEPPDDFSLGMNIKKNNRDDILDHINFSILGFGFLGLLLLPKRINYTISISNNINK